MTKPKPIEKSDTVLEELRGRLDALETLPFLKQPGEAVSIFREMLELLADMQLAIGALSEIKGA